MPAPNPMRGIRRVDRPQKSIHGFEVKILRGGRYHSKFFSDSTHGGRGPALAAAQACYPLLLAKLGPPDKSRRGPRLNPPPLREGAAVPGPLQNPSPDSLVWVQCSDRRCLAYLDERGHWFNFYTHRRLTDFIRILY